MNFEAVDAFRLQSEGLSFRLPDRDGWWPDSPMCPRVRADAKTRPDGNGVGEASPIPAGEVCRGAANKGSGVTRIDLDRFRSQSFGSICRNRVKEKHRNGWTNRRHKKSTQFDHDKIGSVSECWQRGDQCPGIRPKHDCGVRRGTDEERYYQGVAAMSLARLSRVERKGIYAYSEKGA